MVSSVEQRPAETCTPDIVGNAFVRQYYMILHHSPNLVHKFYQDISKLGRPEENGAMSMTTTMEAIDRKILSLEYGELIAEITTVDSQESYNGGVLVHVTGHLDGKDALRRKFSQTFFLAPQEKGYFVLNDVFRYVDEAGSRHVNDNNSTNNVQAPLTPNTVDLSHGHISEQMATLSQGVTKEELSVSSRNLNSSAVEPKASHPVVEVEIPAETTVICEDGPKKSYASILKDIKGNFAPISTATTSIPMVVESETQEHQPNIKPTAAAVLETPGSATNVTGNGSNQDVEDEGPSIYVRGLPKSVTPALLESEFKKFGRIRSGGVQVRWQQGFSFGFVEFEDASAVQSAIEASPVIIGGCKVFVEEKRSTYRRHFRGRSFSGTGNAYRNEIKGPRNGFRNEFHGPRNRFRNDSYNQGNGYRNEGARGRGGNYGGGRGYNRGGDYVNRSNRGGISRDSNRDSKMVSVEKVTSGVVSA